MRGSRAARTWSRRPFSFRRAGLCVGAGTLRGQICGVGGLWGQGTGAGAGEA